MQKTYTSDLTDLGWEVIKTLFKTPPRRRKWSNRVLINAMFYVVKNGCIWRDLPKDFEIPWQTVYYYFRCWSSSGLLELILDTVRRLYRRQCGRAASPSVGVIDSQAIKTSPYGQPKGFDNFKKVKGI